MEPKVQCDVMNDFYSGKISDVRKTETGILLTIDMSEFKQYYHSSFFKCELINCSQFQLTYKKEHIDILDFSKYEIELRDTELRDNVLIMNCGMNNKNHASLLIETETIKVYDELNKVVSLLDLAIYGGLCSSDAGIDFIIGNTQKEASTSERSVKFNEGLLDYLWKQEKYGKRYTEKGPKESFDLLLELDPYGDKIFSKEEIQELITICDGIVEKYKTYHLDDQKIRYFAHKLKELCLEAIFNNKLLVACGD
jgi:hypothetical protein